jgi:hypothetical protein
MKRIFFTLIAICSLQLLLAQSNNILVSDSSKATFQQQLYVPNTIIGKTANGTVYALVQDGMPCFVPDSSTYTKMPVVKASGFNSLAMPNPYKPRLFPGTIDLPKKK